MARKTLMSVGVLAPGLLVATLLLFIVIASVLVSNLVRLRESFSWVQHTNDVISAVAGIQQAVLEAESNERAFLLTGVDAYAADFARTRDQLVSRFESLRALVSDNADQVGSVDALRSVAVMRMTQMQAAVDLGPAKLPQALDILEQTRIEPLTERIETMLSTMMRGEQARLMQRQSQLDSETFNAALITACLLILAVAGIDGNGQRELAEVLAGSRRPDRGRVLLGGRDITSAPVGERIRAGIAYVPVDRATTSLVPAMSVEDNLALRDIDQPPLSHRGWIDRTAVRARAMGRSPPPAFAHLVSFPGGKFQPENRPSHGGPAHPGQRAGLVPIAPFRSPPRV